MILTKASFEIEHCDNGIDVLKRIERAGRTCYRSGELITEDSAKKFVGAIISKGHDSVIEHEKITVRIICDRGVTHEIVRHRIASYSQESTRYCNYAKDRYRNQIEVIELTEILKETTGNQTVLPETQEKVEILPEMVEYWLNEWFAAMEDAELHYMNMANTGCPAQIARDVLPNSVKTEIVVTMNLREWRHFFKMRTSIAAHPQMREISVPMLAKFRELVPVVFDNI